MHALEGLPVHLIGLAHLFSLPGARTLEEALVTTFVEARRTAPSILYLPHLDQWWAAAPVTLRGLLGALLGGLPGDTPLLLLATADERFQDLDPEACRWGAQRVALAG